MRQIVINAKGKRADSLAREVNDTTAEGKDVVLVLGDAVAPERILKIISTTVGEYDVKWLSAMLN